MEYIAHHGIKGQKWGIRRFQNPDGTLTEAGKKKYSKEYKKYASLAAGVANSTSSKRYIDAYNKTVDYFNDNDLTEKYNSDYAKRKGKNAGYMDDPEYEEGYNALFGSIMTEHYNNMLYNDIVNDSNYKKARQIVDKYGLENLDDFTKETEKSLQDLKNEILQNPYPTSNIRGAV